MADSFTTSIRLLKQADQANINIWGKNYNEGVIDLIEEAIAGRADVDVTLGNVTLSVANGTTDQSRPKFLRITGVPGGTRTVTVPALHHMFIVSNLTSPGFDVEVRTSAFAGYVVRPGETVLLMSDPIIGGIIREPFDFSRLYQIAILPFTQVVFDINNRTAGDTTVTANFIRQGDFVYARLPAISTTISSNDFALVPQTPIPGSLLPDFDFECSMCVEDAGTPVDSFIRILTLSTTWVMRNVTLATYTNAATRTLQFQRTMIWQGSG